MLFVIREGDELLCIQAMPVVKAPHSEVLQLFEDLLYNLILSPQDGTDTLHTNFTFLLVSILL